MMNGLHAWEFISGFQRRLQDVSFRIVAAMLVWSGLASRMRPHIVFALGQEGAATKSPNISCTLCACANGTSSISFPSRFSYLIFSVVFSFFFMHACVLWCFPKVRTQAELASRDRSFWKWNRLFPRVTNGKRFPSYMVFRIWLICRSKVKFSLRREWSGRGRQQN